MLGVLDNKVQPRRCPKGLRLRYKCHLYVLSLYNMHSYHHRTFLGNEDSHPKWRCDKYASPHPNGIRQFPCLSIFCSSGYCFICWRVGCIVNSTVIKVGKPIRLEMRMKIPCFNRCKQNVLRSRITQSKSLPQLYFTGFGRSTILRSIVP